MKDDELKKLPFPSAGEDASVESCTACTYTNQIRRIEKKWIEKIAKMEMLPSYSLWVSV